MPRNETQKLKLIRIAQYLLEKTDENNSVSTQDIISMLSENGITAERKSIYSDIEALQNLGMDINITRGRNGGFNLLSRDFQITELKLLVDAIQSSRFITQKKSFELIKKLGNLVSEYDRKELEREVFIVNRIKNENESIYYNTDNIYAAIHDDKQISFLYYNYGADKKKHYHNGGNPIKVSPFALQFDNEKYYLIAYESKSALIKHYRVDKMDKVDIVNESRDGKGYFRKFDVAEYSNATLRMFSGKIESVTLKTPDKFAGAVIDKFGKKVKFIPTEDGEYTVTIDAALTPTLYSWVFTFGGEMTITAPEKAVKEYREQLTQALDRLK
ncbi:MAG: WYL domain-containing protein [Clostridia bacterium]|nr:WYL domain-containing protein [Clostridia bacterium]